MLTPRCTASSAATAARYLRSLRCSRPRKDPPGQAIGRRSGAKSGAGRRRAGGCNACGRGEMREIVVDTETTGLDPEGGHRIVEIACLELLHHVPTGRKFHRYVNPERDMPADAHAVHGLSEEFLSG